MSFDNFYPKRKDKRRVYRKAKAVDRSCRNGGSCPFCQGNRTIQRRKLELAAKEEIESLKQ